MSLMANILLASSIIASVYAQFPHPRSWDTAVVQTREHCPSFCGKSAADLNEHIPGAPSNISYTCGPESEEKFLDCPNGVCFYQCKCKECRRDCYLDEVINLSKCNIDPIPLIEGNIGQKIVETAIDVAIGSIPGIGVAIAFGKAVYKTMTNQSPLDGLIGDINKRVANLGLCMGEMISEVTSGETYDDIERAYIAYQSAADYYPSDYDPCDQRCYIQKAFDEFYAVIMAEFGTDDLNHQALHFTKLLLPTQNFAALFALVSVDYLSILRSEQTANDHHLYDTKLQYTVDAFLNLYTWVQRAHEVIVTDLWSKAYQLPCKGTETLQVGMDQWDHAFYEANTTPLWNNLRSFMAMQQADHTTAVLVEERKSCRSVTIHFPEEVKSAEECALRALFHPNECYTGWFQIALRSGNGHWGCHCCAENTELLAHGDIDVYRVYTVPSGGHHSAKAVEESSIAMDAPMDSVMTMDEGMQMDDTLYEGEICEWDGKPNIDVVSVNGVYFSFDADVMGTILGQSSWATRLYVVYNERTETEINVRMWMDEDDGPLGRTYPFADAKDGDWEEGDVLRFVYGECEEGLQCKETDREAHTCQEKANAF